MASIFLAIHYGAESLDHVVAWQQSLGDGELQRAAPPDGDDLAPAEILALAARLPIALSASNEGWGRLETAPLGEALRVLFQSGRVTPLLAHGYSQHAAFLTPDELALELAINDSFLRRAGAAGYRGGYAEGLCLDLDSASAYLNAGASWVIAAGAGLPSPFLAGSLLVVPPAASGFDGVINIKGLAPGAGGEPVLVHFAVKTQREWKAVEEFVANAEAHGHTWASGKNINWQPQGSTNRQARFGFYPRHADIVRTDGVYRSLRHSVEGPDAYQPVALYERRPFVLWEAGLPLVHLARFLVGSFAQSQHALASASEALSALRYLQSAHRWGIAPSLQEEKGVALAVIVLARALHGQLHDGVTPRQARPVNPGTVQALRASLAFQIDNRLNALEFGLQEFAGATQLAHARAWVVEAREHRLRAAETLTRLEAALQAVAITPGAWYRVIDMLGAYGRERFSAVDALARVALAADGAPEIGTFYEGYLAKIWPPQGAVMLDRFYASAPQHPAYGEVQGLPRHPEGRP